MHHAGRFRGSALLFQLQAFPVWNAEHVGIITKFHPRLWIFAPHVAVVGGVVVEKLLAVDVPQRSLSNVGTLLVVVDDIAHEYVVGSLCEDKALTQPTLEVHVGSSDVCNSPDRVS